MANIPCPYDTNGDGDCGKPACPFCGKYFYYPTLSYNAIYVYSKHEEYLLREKLLRAGAQEIEHHFGDIGGNSIYELPVIVQSYFPRGKAVLINHDTQNATIIDLEDEK